MRRRDLLKGFAAGGAALAAPRVVLAQDVIKIGACLSLVGGFQTVGRQALAGAKLYMALNGNKVAGKTIELIRIKAGKVTREAVPIDNPKPVVGVVVDKQARVAIALRDGRIALRDKGTWTVSEVREELAAPKPGPEPAESP